MKIQKILRLNDVCELIVDYLHKTAPTQEEGYPLIRTPNIKRGRLDLSSVFRVSEEIYDIWNQRAVPQTNDLIMAREAPAGNVAIIKEGQIVCLGQRTVLIRPNIELVDPDFLCYFLLVPKQQGKLLAGETGATVKHVNMKDIRKLPLQHLPDLPIQKKIGKILASYDDLIENNRRRIQLLEESARLLYREWFVYLRFPGHEHTPIIDGIPEDWEKIHLSKVVKTQYGFTETAQYEPIGPKFLRGKDINKTSYIEWNTVPYCSKENLEFNKFSLMVGDIVVIRMANPGEVGIIEKEIESVFASYLVRFQIKIRVNITSYFLFYTLCSEQYQGFIKAASTGSTRKSASAKLLVDFNIIIPSIRLLTLFDKQIIPIRKQINILLDQNASLQQARDILLPRLMNGEINL
ncbi:MAG: restriction endonuclease subunit S [Microcoleaceae cyanobacterium]